MSNGVWPRWTSFKLYDDCNAVLVSRSDINSSGFNNAFDAIIDKHQALF
ncbi:hypothetical protein AEYBE204_04615 [Asticcacaulis sp. YBE204]|nr:hypothetical protein AEYBE204_04615 [Asticcacaulis sp. YBE204]